MSLVHLWRLRTEKGRLCSLSVSCTDAALSSVRLGVVPALLYDLLSVMQRIVLRYSTSIGRRVLRS